MSIEELRSFRNARPFHPFEIILNDGRTFHVPIAERLGIAPGGNFGIYVGGIPYISPVAEIRELRVVSSAPSDSK